MQKPQVTPEVTAKMPNIRTSISGKADVIEAGKKEKSPFDKSQISSQSVLKLNVRFWIQLQGTSTSHSLTGWYRLIPSGSQVKKSEQGVLCPETDLKLEPEWTPFPSFPTLRWAQGWSRPGWCQEASPI